MGLNYYDDMNNESLSDLLRQANIKTENQFMDFSYSIWQDFPDTDISIGAYIILYYIKVVQLTMAHIFQYHMLNQVQKVSTMQHALQE